ncbi:hypothetical protein SAMN05661093_10877 [Kibdelosporangium aridum]|uniref:Tetratricopeptide repeat protein n=1 Tax=Kibdelosporangium aridum TaxID=2030 RepID=A0A1W2FZR2_KIBAR|nr:hypothetical protein SAMN05661093_10877 [Kibdelosporangium aridum]
MPQTDRPQAPDCLTHLTGPHEWPPCPYLPVDRAFITGQTRSAAFWNLTGKPGQAAELYGHVLKTEPLSRRDRGYFMARMASSLALSGEPDEASLVGIQAVELASATSSLRTKRELRRTLQVLTPWSGRPGPVELRSALSDWNVTAPQ